MAKPLGMHDTGQQVKTQEQYRSDLVEYIKAIEKTKRLDVGEEYTLYVPFKSAKQITNTAIEKKRILVGHYGRFARFKSKAGIYESWLYSELAKAIRKPGKNVKIIKEEESWLSERGK